eukprot:TRINITY_DN32651_c0_g1_i1.p1 TRINITY_DN32651_c0_g1~~TRINITY_DN32651_c0_g1_i1.p1  ORF type:complete len:500 (+),score=104.91 TRINITY_DN32651_c0_g1_i1:210-1709(+)
MGGHTCEAVDKRASYFWMGLDTYKIPMAMYAENRAKLVQRLENEGLVEGVVLLQGGESATRYDTDTEPLFRQESYFAYLFGVTEPDFYGAVDVATGKSILFIPRLPASYGVWYGKIHDPSFFKEKYSVDEAYYSDEICQVLLGAMKNELSPLYLLYGLNTDSNNKSKPAQFEGIEKFNSDLTKLHASITECRVFKSKKEQDLLRYVCRVSSAAHVEVMRAIKPGEMEYQSEARFLHYMYGTGGCRNVSYTCICASGENSGTLHYGHAGAPNDKLIKAGEIALFDMGAEYNCYCSDVTCTFPVSGKFTADQRMVYETVLAAQRAVMAAMRPGVNWQEMHRLAERTILEHLKKGGLLKGDVGEMADLFMGAVFMPHGLGHFLGLDTHDVGGYPQGVVRSEEPGLKSLRTARTLQAGMVITVEPGCYFIDMLLDAALEAPETAHFFVPSVLDRFRGMGGVRIEDDVLVTADGIENFTRCPRDVADIESVMAGGPWTAPHPFF